MRTSHYATFQWSIFYMKSEIRPKDGSCWWKEIQLDRLTGLLVVLGCVQPVCSHLMLVSNFVTGMPQFTLMLSLCIFPISHTVWLVIAVSFNSFMSYAYMSYQPLKELSLYVQRYPHCTLFSHGFLWAIFLSPHWYVLCFMVVELPF